MLPDFSVYGQPSFPLAAALPPDYRGLVLRGGTVSFMQDETGTIVLQEVKRPDFSIRFNGFRFLKPVKLPAMQESTVLVALLALKHNIQWTFNGFRKLHLKQNQFALLHTPGRKLQALFNKNRSYQVLEIEWSAERLREMLPYFPFLEPLFQSENAGKSFFIRSPGITAGPAVLHVAGEMLRNHYDEAHGDIYLSYKVREYLFLLMMEASKQQPDLKLTDAERTIIINIGEMLGSHPDKKFPIEALAREAGMNQMKLKMAFRAVHGMPIYQYHLAARMQEAHRLLQETTLSTKQVAAKVGYRSASNFLEAFNDQFGYSASSIQKT